MVEMGGIEEVEMGSRMEEMEMGGIKKVETND